jgi:hypothetical protein
MRLSLQWSSCIFTQFRWFRHKPSLACVSLTGQRMFVHFPRTISLTRLVQFCINPSSQKKIHGDPNGPRDSITGRIFRSSNVTRASPPEETLLPFSAFHFLRPPYALKTAAKGPSEWCGPRAHIPFRFWASDGGFSERRVLVSQSIGPNTPPCSTMRSSSMTPTTQWPSRRPILQCTRQSQLWCFTVNSGLFAYAVREST